jgi:hypothetical protein
MERPVEEQKTKVRCDAMRERPTNSDQPRSCKIVNERAPETRVAGAFGFKATSPVEDGTRRASLCVRHERMRQPVLQRLIAGFCDDDGFRKAVLRAAAIGMNEELHEAEAALKRRGAVAKGSLH